MQLNGPFRRIGFTFIPESWSENLPNDSAITFDGVEYTGHAFDPISIDCPQKAAFNFGEYCRSLLPNCQNGYVRVDLIAENDDTGDCRITAGELILDNGKWEWRPWEDGDTPNPLVPALAACRLLIEAEQATPEAIALANLAISQAEGK